MKTISIGTDRATVELSKEELGLIHERVVAGARLSRGEIRSEAS